MNLTKPALAALCVAALLAACGDSSSSPGPTESALRSTAEDYFEAFVGADGRRVSELTDPACGLSVADATSAMLIAAGFSYGFAGANMEEFEYSITAVNVSGKTGAVTTEVSVDGEAFAEEDVTADFVFIDGEGWRADDCLDLDVSE